MTFRAHGRNVENETRRVRELGQLMQLFTVRRGVRMSFSEVVAALRADGHRSRISYVRKAVAQLQREGWLTREPPTGSETERWYRPGEVRRGA